MYVCMYDVRIIHVHTLIMVGEYNEAAYLNGARHSGIGLQEVQPDQ